MSSSVPDGHGVTGHGASGARAGRFLVTVALGALLAGSAWAAAPPGSKDDGSVHLEVEGLWTHPSGMTFPERAAAFRRVSVTRFPGGEDNFGVGYELAEGGDKLASVTVYVYPNPGLGVDDHFGQVVADVTDSHGVPPRSRATVAVPQQGGTANGRGATWSYREAFGRREQDVESRAMLFTRGPWFVKYRVTFPASRQGRVEVELDDLLHALTMPAE